MTIFPVPGISGDLFLGELRSAKTSLSNVGSGDIQILFTDYVTWANRHAEGLGRYLSREHLNSLITTPRYWTLQSLIPMINYPAGNIGPHGQISINGLLRLELAERNRELEQTIREIEQGLSVWSTMDSVIVIADTNIYLHQKDEFDQLDWNALAEADKNGVHLVIPLIVLEELDRSKRINGKAVSESNKTTVRSRARVTLGKINDLFEGTLKQAYLETSSTSVSLLLEDTNHVPLRDADSEFLDRAQALRDFIDREVCVITSDVSMEFRARSIGLKTKLLRDD